MKTRISATISLYPLPEQFQILQASHQAYQDAWYYVSRYAFEQKLCTIQTLRAGTYTALRQQFHLPSTWARRILREVGQLYQGLWKKIEHNTLLQCDRRTIKRYTVLNQAPLYATSMVSYQYGKDYCFQDDTSVSLLTLDGRLSIPYTCDHHHMALIQLGAMIGEAQLWYDQHHRAFSVRITLEGEARSTTPEIPT